LGSSRPPRAMGGGQVKRAYGSNINDASICVLKKNPIKFLAPKFHRAHPSFRRIPRLSRLVVSIFPLPRIVSKMIFKPCLIPRSRTTRSPN
jgi:hypothetical protein